MTSGATGACDRCLRRAMLLGRLAPYIERVATAQPRSRAQELLALSDSALAGAVAGPRADRLLAAAAADDPTALRRKLVDADCWALCRHEPGYPEQLRDLGNEAPAALLGRGDAALLRGPDGEPAITVVGSRHGSAYGLGVADDLGRMLAAARITTVSGLALGIDSAAHRGALAGRGRTLAVLGSGPDRPYPPSNRHLYARVLEREGAVVSELPPGTGAFRWTFPARNRVMAALAGMTVVVEAAERSGSLITATMAQDIGREIGAVPGPVNSWLSAGTNALLKDGAHVIRDAQDVLDVMLGPGAGVARPTGPALDDRLARALAQVEGGRRTADAVALGIAGEAGEAGAALARLELLGYVQSDVTGAYARTQLIAPDGVAEAGSGPS
jgi:DNA processing protein